MTEQYEKQGKVYVDKDLFKNLAKLKTKLGAWVQILKNDAIEDGKLTAISKPNLKFIDTPNNELNNDNLSPKSGSHFLEEKGKKKKHCKKKKLVNKLSPSVNYDKINKTNIKQHLRNQLDHIKSIEIEEPESDILVDSRTLNSASGKRTLKKIMSEGSLNKMLYGTKTYYPYFVKDPREIYDRKIHLKTEMIKKVTNSSKIKKILNRPKSN